MKNKKIFIVVLIVILATMVSTTFAVGKSVFPVGTGIVTIANRFNGESIVTFDGRYFKNGDQVHIYSNSSATYQVGLIPLAFNQYLDDVVVRIPQLGQSSGSLYVTLTDALGDSESDVVKIDYVQAVNIVNNVDKADTVIFTGLLEKDIVKVYDAAGKTLGTATATVDGDVIVSLSSQLPEPSVGGSFMVYVTAKSFGQTTEGVKTPVIYSPAGITVASVGTIAVAGKVADIIVTNNLTTTDTVTFFNLKAKDVATVYAPDAIGAVATFLSTSDSTVVYATSKTTVLGTAIAAKDGDLVVKLTKQLSETDKRIYVSIKNYNLFESPVTLLQYYRAGQAPSTDTNNLAITISPSTYNIITTSNMVFISGVKVNDVVTVYDSGTHKLIGIATVASGKDYVIINFISTSHSIYLKNKEVDKLISDASSLITLSK